MAVGFTGIRRKQIRRGSSPPGMCQQEATGGRLGCCPTTAITAFSCSPPPPPHPSDEQSLSIALSGLSVDMLSRL